MNENNVFYILKFKVCILKSGLYLVYKFILIDFLFFKSFM